MSESAHNPDDYCYRHPDRLSFVLCERCGRTICLECQHTVDGRVLCPDDAEARVTQISEAREAHEKREKRMRRRTRTRLLDRVSTETPIITYGAMGVLVVTFLIDTITRNLLTTYLGVYPAGTPGVNDVIHQPWSLLTSMILPGGIFGLLFNGFSLFMLGRQLERFFGHARLILLLVVGGFGAAVVSFLLDGFVLSAVGPVFGLVGAIVILARRMGGNQTTLYIICAISLLFAIFLGGWQAAIGGGLAGAAIAATYFYENKAREARTRLLLVAIVLVLLVIAVVRALAFQG